MEAGIAVIILGLLLCSCLCFLLGMFVGNSRKNTKELKGNLNVDCSDPTVGAYLYLELNVPISEIADLKQATFNVRVIR